MKNMKHWWRSPSESSKNRIYARILAVILLLGMLSTGVSVPMRADAYDEVNSLSVTVGYWGDTDYERDIVSLSDLAAACGTHQVVYTWINAGNNPGTTEAEGIYLSDIINYLGIDSGSIYYYNFYTPDAPTYGGSMQQWSTDQLFGGRYTYWNSFAAVLDDYYNSDPEEYLKNPESHYTIENVFDFDNMKYSDDAWSAREPVEPMLALRTRSVNWKGYTPASSLDFSGMDEIGKPILVFGQAGKNDITRNLMAQMVTQIHIWFEGAPEITLEAEENEGEIGDSKGYTLTVRTPDDFLTQKILEGIRIESSDNSIAEVDEDGNITITGEGTAEIKATYNGREVGKFSMTGNKKPEEEPEEKEDPEEEKPGNGDGKGKSEGSGDGSSSGKNNGTGAGTGDKDGSATGSGNKDSSSTGKRVEGSSMNKKTIKTTDASKKKKSESTGDKRSKDGSQEAGSAGGKASGSGKNNVKVYEISPEDNLYVESAIDENVSRWVWIIALLALIGGGSMETVYYRGQTHWIEKAKRMYEKS